MRYVVVMLGVIVALGIAVAGCAGDDVAGTPSTGEDLDPTTTSERTPTSPRETTVSSSPPVGSNEVTPPGSQLTVGDPAVVPVEFGGKSGLISITVTAIEQGDQAAFAQKFGAKAQGLVPYYLKLTARNVGDTDLSHTSLPLVSALLADGRLTGVSIVGELADCQKESFPSDSGQGATVESCVLAAAEEADQVTGARYSESDGGYVDKPIVWQGSEP